MPRGTFQQELDRLVEEVVDLGREVESCLGTMVEALETHDAEIARKVFGVDATYKERGAQIAEECLILQARQAPVARDLRLIYTVQIVQNHLVRAGTLCEHIFEVRDIDRARDLEAADDKIDLLYSEALNLAVNPGKDGGGSPEWRVWAA